MVPVPLRLCAADALMPASADCMLDQLAVKPEHRTFASLALAEAMVSAGTPVVKPAG